jgi:hypothetical protein
MFRLFSHNSETGSNGSLSLLFGSRDHFRPMKVQFGQGLMVAVQHGSVGQELSTL